MCESFFCFLRNLNIGGETNPGPHLDKDRGGGGGGTGQTPSKFGGLEGMFPQDILIKTRHYEDMQRGYTNTDRETPKQPPEYGPETRKHR